MSKPTPLINGQFYHIYNKAVGEENLFRNKQDYERFLILYAEYISPVAETYAWVLMGNHFHLLIRVLDQELIPYIKPTDRNRDKVYETNHQYNPSNQFRHLFDAYARYYNTRYGRLGALFCKPFRRSWVDNNRYFKNLIFYIHNNPVHHHFVEHLVEYPWSSYLSVITQKPTRLCREKVIGWFNSSSEFVDFHQMQHNHNEIKEYIIED